MRVGSIAVAFVAYVGGCSSPSRDYSAFDTGTSEPGDARVDDGATAPVDTSYVLEGYVPCGEPPYIPLQYQLNDVKRKPISDIRVLVSACPTLPQLSGTDGTVRFLLPRGKPLYLMMEYEPIGLVSVEGEYLFEFPTGFISYFLPRARQVPLPRADEARLSPVMYLDSTRPAPCNDGNGVSYSVKDHPEAVVTYYDDVGPIPGATQTAAGHWDARVSGLTAGTYVQLEAHKTGCKLTTYVGGGDFGNNTGRSPLVAGHDSIVTVLIESLPTGDAGADGGGD